jgi:hypothetical protein
MWNKTVSVPKCKYYAGAICGIVQYITHTITFPGYGAVNIRSFKTVGAVACPRLCQFAFISLFVWFAVVRRGHPRALQRRLQPEMAGAPLPAWLARTADRSGLSHKEFQLHIVYSFLNSTAVAPLLIRNGFLLIRLCVYLFTYNVSIDCSRFQNDRSGKWCSVQIDLNKHS